MVVKKMVTQERLTADVRNYPIQSLDGFYVHTLYNSFYDTMQQEKLQMNWEAIKSGAFFQDRLNRQKQREAGIMAQLDPLAKLAGYEGGFKEMLAEKSEPLKKLVSELDVLKTKKGFFSEGKVKNLREIQTESKLLNSLLQETADFLYDGTNQGIDMQHVNRMKNAYAGLAKAATGKQAYWSLNQIAGSLVERAVGKMFAEMIEQLNAPSSAGLIWEDTNVNSANFPHVDGRISINNQTILSVNIKSTPERSLQYWGSYLVSGGSANATKEARFQQLFEIGSRASGNEQMNELIRYIIINHIRFAEGGGSFRDPSGRTQRMNITGQAAMEKHLKDEHMNILGQWISGAGYLFMSSSILDEHLGHFKSNLTGENLQKDNYISDILFVGGNILFKSQILEAIVTDPQVAKMGMTFDKKPATHFMAKIGTKQSKPATYWKAYDLEKDKFLRGNSGLQKGQTYGDMSFYSMLHNAFTGEAKGVWDKIQLSSVRLRGDFSNIK